MSYIIDGKCARCSQEFALGDLTLPVWRVTHKGRVYTEVDPAARHTSPIMVHVTCPTVEAGG